MENVPSSVVVVVAVLFVVAFAVEVTTDLLCICLLKDKLRENQRRAARHARDQEIERRDAQPPAGQSPRPPLSGFTTPQ